jgi:hypothetical protein
LKSELAIVLWRFVVALSLAGWWGALTFYGAVVVAEGTAQLGSQTQGLVTQQVTKTLNLLGAGLAVLVFCELCRRGGWWNWLLWGSFAICQAMLFGVHVWLSELLLAGTAGGTDRAHFYDVHRVYLLTTALQWGCGPCLLLSLMRAWRRDTG